MKPAAVTTKQQKQAIDEYAREQMRKQAHGATRRAFKLMCLALHNEFGFGAVRAGRLIAAVNSVAHESEHDPVFWAHVDRVMTQMRLEFEPENYEEMGE
jgi:hypothetical protein